MSFLIILNTQNRSRVKKSSIILTPLNRLFKMAFESHFCGNHWLNFMIFGLFDMLLQNNYQDNVQFFFAWTSNHCFVYKVNGDGLACGQKITCGQSNACGQNLYTSDFLYTTVTKFLSTTDFLYTNVTASIFCYQKK